MEAEHHPAKARESGAGLGPPPPLAQAPNAAALVRRDARWWQRCPPRSLSRRGVGPQRGAAAEMAAPFDGGRPHRCQAPADQRRRRPPPCGCLGPSSARPPVRRELRGWPARSRTDRLNCAVMPAQIRETVGAPAWNLHWRDVLCRGGAGCVAQTGGIIDHRAESRPRQRLGVCPVSRWLSPPEQYAVHLGYAYRLFLARLAPTVAGMKGPPPTSIDPSSRQALATAFYKHVHSAHPRRRAFRGAARRLHRARLQLGMPVIRGPTILEEHFKAMGMALRLRARSARLAWLISIAACAITCRRCE